MKPPVDVHTLGVSAVEQLLASCGVRVIAAESPVAEALGAISRPESIRVIEQAVRRHGVTRLGVSYRLEASDGAELFGRLMWQLRNRRLFVDQGGPLVWVYFAGLPVTCRRVSREHRQCVTVFFGDESTTETLDKLGVSPLHRPRDVLESSEYDETRLAFARELIRTETHKKSHQGDTVGYPQFGTRLDHVEKRIRDRANRGLLPLMRAHVGPYSPDRVAAVHQFLDWARQLAAAGSLDVLSVGSSQLTQSHFGEDWGDRPNGGGVPINSPVEFQALWEAARPMLVRTYAGTKNIPRLARMYEETINIAWHALSFWWFCQIDGRGPLTVRENLNEHIATLRFVASSGKPFEPNISHHFAFRGADDVTYVVAAVLAARTAKSLGVRSLILQNMLNTPKGTWGIQDLAKSRAMLKLVRELEDASFRVYLQPRAGLDYLSHDLDKAKIQLAAASALMDDIEPHNPLSPSIVHVVSYSEGSHLADPAVILESVRITRAAIHAYRGLRKACQIDDMSGHEEVSQRVDDALTSTLHAINS